MSKPKKKSRSVRKRKPRAPVVVLRTEAQLVEARAALPPNENIRKHPDEVYGDTEIPSRRHP